MRRSSLTLLALVLPILGMCSPETGRAERPPTPDPTYGVRVPRQPHPQPVEAPEAKWVWTARTADQQVIGARKTFQLPRQPQNATALVSADNLFKLYVNGALVGQTTPQPGGFEWRTAHRYDIGVHLHPGRNVVAIEGRNDTGAAGMLMAFHYTVDGAVHTMVTDGSWKVMENPPAGWETSEFNDDGWAAATVIAPLDGGPWGSELSGWPGLNGSAPYLVRKDIPVVAVLSAEPRKGSLQNAESLNRGGESRLVMVPAPAGTPEADSPAVAVDFGQETSGRVDVVNGADTPISITLRYGESEDEARFGPYTGVQKITIPAHGTGSGIDSAFRYAIVTLMSGPASGAPIRAIRLNMDYYPVAYKGSFDSSDPLLNRIWYVGAYTAHLCMQRDIWDAPKRDRARWMGDLQVSGEVINNAFLDRFLMEQTMDRLRSDAGNPPHSHVNGIPGYSCAWVVGMADFYRHTGDRAYILKHHDDLISMMDYFRGELDDHGIFANKRGQWDFVDWSPGFNGGGPHSLAATHFYMVRMLRDGAWLLTQMGDADAAKRYQSWAGQATAAAQNFLQAADGTFGDRWQDNAMAIESSVASPEETAAIWDHVLSHPYPVDLMITPYYNNYDIFAMSDAGHTEDAVQFVRDYWGAMIREGATTFWEGYDPRWPKEHFHRFLQADNGMGYFVSLCHGWSAGATNLLTERVLGVQSTGPGFATVRIEPHVGDLSWARGVIPTPHGPIRVSYRRKGMQLQHQVSLPAGVIGTIVLPGKAPTVFSGPGTFGAKQVISTAPKRR